MKTYSKNSTVRKPMMYGGGASMPKKKMMGGGMMGMKHGGKAHYGKKKVDVTKKRLRIKTLRGVER